MYDLGDIFYKTDTVSEAYILENKNGVYKLRNLYGNSYLLKSDNKYDLYETIDIYVKKGLLVKTGSNALKNSDSEKLINIKRNLNNFEKIYKRNTDEKTKEYITLGFLKIINDIIDGI